jgi:hypothetical protein
MAEMEEQDILLLSQDLLLVMLAAVAEEDIALELEEEQHLAVGQEELVQRDLQEPLIEEGEVVEEVKVLEVQVHLEVLLGAMVDLELSLFVTLVLKKLLEVL